MFLSFMKLDSQLWLQFHADNKLSVLLQPHRLPTFGAGMRDAVVFMVPELGTVPPEHHTAALG